LRGDVAPLPDLTLAEFVEVYLQRHQVNVRSRTIAVLRERLAYAVRAYGDVPRPQLQTPLLFPAPAGGLLHLDNFRRREWSPAIKTSGVTTPARIYDLRSTFASRALAAGVSAFELARVIGTSVQMIERHYGTLLDGAGAGIAARLDAFVLDTSTAEGRQ
jgi:integrase